MKQKSFVPEKCWAISCSSDGKLCAAGGESGSIHLWDVSTGKLLRSWVAHHKRITTLCFSDLGTEIVSGSEDSLVAAWSVPRLFGTGGTHSEPIHIWSDHTLSIEQVVVGSGSSDPYVYACSLDHCVSIRSLLSGYLLRKIQLPAALSCICLDPTEHAAYVGSKNGMIYNISFVHEPEESMDSLQQGSENRKIRVLQGHMSDVTTLCLSRDSSKLVSGSENGVLLVWDTFTGQQMRKTSVGSFVSSVLVVNHPIELLGHGKGQMSQDSQVRLEPLGNFTKVAGSPGVPGKPWDDGLILLDGGDTLDDHNDEEEHERSSIFRSSSLHMDSIQPNKDSPQGLQSNQIHQDLLQKIARLEKENEALQEQKKRFLAVMQNQSS